jgi:hypothetical protein
MLPGGKAMIYTSYATPISRARIMAYDFGNEAHESSDRRRCIREIRDERASRLLTRRCNLRGSFDPKSLEVKGTPVLFRMMWTGPRRMDSVRTRSPRTERSRISRHRSGMSSDVLCGQTAQVTSRRHFLATECLRSRGCRRMESGL